MNQERMMREEFGICGIRLREKGLCENVKGFCSTHPEQEKRCQSVRDASPDQQCWMRRSKGGFCSYHNRFPNLGALLNKYAEKDLSQCSLEEFIAIYYPTQSVHCFEAEGRDFGILLKNAAKTMGA